MKMSTGIILVWQLAAQETVAASFKEIQPEHLLEALLKFSDLDHNQAHRAVSDIQAAKQLCSEIDSVRHELMKRSINGTTRRTIRMRLGRGGDVYAGGTVHRSAKSRALFDAAAGLAAKDRCEVVESSHLLKALLDSPAQNMAKLLGEIARLESEAKVFTPQLDKWGKDLCASTNADRSNKDADLTPEVKALLRTLSAPDKPSVLLVTNYDEFAHAVVAGAASLLANEGGTHAKRIIDVTSLDSAEADAEATDALRTLLREAAHIPGLVVYLPAIINIGQAGKPNEWVVTFKNAMVQQRVQCICRVGPEEYRRHIAGDITLKGVTRAIWLHASKPWRLPSRL